MGPKSIFSSLINFLVFLFTAISILLVAPGISPHINFESYSVTPARNLEGNLAPNSVLDKAKPLNLDREIIGPESIAVRGKEIFTGVQSGEIIKIKNGKVTTVAKTGVDCGEEGHMDKKECGRPLGMRFDGQGKLVVADAYQGILRVNVDTGSFEMLVSMYEMIDGKLPKFPDDVDIDKSGNVYWSDASTNGGMDYGLLELLGEASGRLIKYDAELRSSEVLLEGIHFANGIQLSENEDFVMVNEFVRARVLRYFIKGSRKGEHEVFVDGLPGYPDNIRSNGHGGFYISLVMPRLPHTFNFPDVLGEKPLIRKFILRVQQLLLSVVRFIEVFTGHGIFLEEVKVTIKTGLMPTISKEVIIVEIDKNGKIIGSLQNQNGNISIISEINVGRKMTYFGSPVTKQIWEIQTKDLKQ